MPEKGVTHVSGTGVTYVPSLYTYKGGGVKRRVEGCGTVSDGEGGHIPCDPLANRSSWTCGEMFVNNAG